ncbi:unnamed protein product [Soboliphyme baturini]|uniref:Nucleolar protein 14 n=1 Tax=Soboliphyme baturini TaxID=241478 RepID=A0A183ID61_9BILA|nr:unnamed protein product [Soboliphyme baturini]
MLLRPRLAEGGEQVLIADFSQSASVPPTVFTALGNQGDDGAACLSFPPAYAAVSNPGDNRAGIPFDDSQYDVSMVALGRRLDHGERGNPLVSHAKALKQRQQTLLKEYVRFGKKNRLRDRRVGEHRKNLSKQQKMAMRFALERQRLFTKNKTSDLGDEELLTHHGRTLADIEKFEQPSSDDDDDDEQEASDKLSADFVKNAHFVTGSCSQEQTEGRKTLIQSIIEKSKAVKLERQMQRDKMEVLTEQLDNQWKEVLEKNLMHRLLKRTKDEQVNQPVRQQVDDYDRLVREMQLGGRRVQSAVKAQTPEAVAKSDRQRLERLEAERTAIFQPKEAVDIALDDPQSSLPQNSQFESHHTSVEIDVFNNYPGIPFVFEMPKSYDDFLSLVSSHCPKIQGVVLRRLIKCHHPSLHPNNHKRLCNLFVYALRYFDSAVSKNFDLPLLNLLTVILRALANMEPIHALKCAYAVLNRYKTSVDGFSELSCFIFLRLLPRMFDVSLAGKNILTNAARFMAQSLSSARIKCHKDVLRSLLLIMTFIEYLKIMKIYVPEIVVSLINVIQIATSSSEPYGIHFANLEGPHRPKVGLLYIDEPCSATDEEIQISIPQIFSSTSMENEETLKVLAIGIALQLIKQLTDLWSDLPSVTEIFSPIFRLLTFLPKQNYPSNLRNSVDEIFSHLEALKRSTPVPQVCLKPEIKQFKFKEPLIEAKFNPERRKTVKGKLAEKKLLVRKYKREFRGTVRELRRDSQFIARQQAMDRAELDTERERKTKLIMKSLVEQETEYKKSKRRK